MEKYSSRKPSPSISTSVFSSIYTWWVTPHALQVRKCGLKLEDVPEPPTDMKAGIASKRINEIRNTRITDATSAWQMQYYFVKLAIYSSPLFIIAILTAITIVLTCDIASPLLIDCLLRAKFAKEDSVSTYAVLICIATILKAVMFYCSVFISDRLGNKLKSAYTALIMAKVMSLSEYDISDVSLAHITNLASTDVNIIHMGGYYMFSAVRVIMAIILSTVVCWYLMGWLCIITIGVLALQLVIQIVLSTKYKTIREKISQYSDQRMKITTDVLKGIKIIKMNAWERSFQTTINTTRKLEMKISRQSIFLHSLIMSVYSILPRLQTFLIILVYTSVYNEFPITAILPYNGITDIVNSSVGFLLPMTLSTNIEAQVSIKRIEKFLHLKPTTKCTSENITAKNISLDLQNVYCSPNNADNCTLNGITLSATRSDLIGITGKVGSGKSTLLRAILGEIPIKSGTISFQGSIAYVPQEPWVFSASVEQNITFGQELNNIKLQQALEASALSQDINAFPNGVHQIVGPRGIKLSGGQKARLNLARAIYADADIYLLDDPLSAVDINIGKEIYKRCITDFMSRKICILVTHQTHFLKNTTMNINICEGHAYSEIQPFADNLCDMPDQEINTETGTMILNNSKDTPENDDESKLSEKQMEKDFHKKGGTSFKMYWQYFAVNSSKTLFLAFATMTLIYNGLLCASLLWIGIWINAEADALEKQEMSAVNVTRNATLNMESNNFNRNHYFTTFAALTFGVMAAAIGAFPVLSQIAYQSSSNIHKNLLQSIMSAKMTIFETHPIGVFVNRFSLDLKKVDIDIPQNIVTVTLTSSTCIAYLIMTLIGDYWLAIPFVILGSIQMFAFKTIFHILRETMRVEGTAQSALYTKLVNAISGLAVIKAFQKQQIMQAEFENSLDTCTSAQFLKSSFYLWGSQIVQLTTASYIVACVILAAVFADASIGTIALSLVSSFAFVDIFFWRNVQYGNLDSEMNSLERIMHYSDLPKETNRHFHKCIQKGSWPGEGEIICENMSMKYSENGRDILKNINIHIKPTEKVGIVGRTGAGKSSIFSAIYGLHMHTGKIVIDGVNTNEISLHDLRSNLSIIPQDPTFFYGTIRTNIDPLNMYTDKDIWNAIEQVQMKDAIEKLCKGLDFQVAEGGSNFSVGERQLLCLARAILRNNKILMLDEATANVDNKTDTIIQATIRSHFKNCTVITIAHRLNTVLDSDKILVLDNGSIVEFGEPQELLEKDSTFRKLAINHSANKQ